LAADYASKGRDRLNGRAADVLAASLPCRDAAEFADDPCALALLRSRHVHVEPRGRIIPGTCAGIVLGDLARTSAAEAWRALEADHARRPVVGRLAALGPAGILNEAVAAGFVPGSRGYAAKCHLCWDVRRWFFASRLHLDELGPAWLYEAGSGGTSGQGAA